VTHLLSSASVSYYYYPLAQLTFDISFVDRAFSPQSAKGWQIEKGQRKDVGDTLECNNVKAADMEQLCPKADNQYNLWVPDKDIAGLASCWAPKVYCSDEQYKGSSLCTALDGVLNSCYSIYNYKECLAGSQTFVGSDPKVPAPSGTVTWNTVNVSQLVSVPYHVVNRQQHKRCFD